MKSFSIFLVFFVIAGMSNFAQVVLSGRWGTTFELSDSTRTPRYKETMEYFGRLAAASPYAKLISFGRSPQGRDLKCLIVSKDRAFTPALAARTGKPTVMINNGIHSGEIEGKDACMLLLREILITGSKKHYLDHVNLLVIPIISVDGHERFGPYNRINQNGPAEMGWRTTAQNLNLNRDWLKADTPEMQAMLQLVKQWQPDFFFDTHTTDGADFQYEANYGVEKFQNSDPGIASMIRNEFVPFLESGSARKGILIGPYVDFKDSDVLKGIFEWPGTPRYSTGYFAVRNRPSLLIETHMLKPFKRRVMATKCIIETALDFIEQNGPRIVRLNRQADEFAISEYFACRRPYAIKLKSSQRHTRFFWRGVKYNIDSSDISGDRRVTFTGEPANDSVDYYNQADVTDSVSAPYGYIVPPEWSLIVDRLRLHGVTVRQIKKAAAAEVTTYRFANVNFAAAPYEGRQTVSFECTAHHERRDVTAGAYFITCDQPLIKLILMALEPRSEDSFIRWGFMNQIFEKKEYYERYVMEKIGKKMLEEDNALREEFESKLKNDEEFRQSPARRLDFFYIRSPYYDKSKSAYPIFRVEKKGEIL